MNRVTIRRQVVKRCPFRDEWDIGTLTITLAEDLVPELHELGAQIDAIADPEVGTLTHEEYQRRLREEILKGLDAEIVTTWRTGPWDVECST